MTVIDAHRIITIIFEKRRWTALIGGVELHAATKEEAEKKAVEYILRDPLLADFERQVRLKEAELWDKNAARPDHFIPFSKIVKWAEERIQELEKP